MRRIGNVGYDRADLLHIAENLDALAGQKLLGNRRRGDATKRLAGAGSASAAIVAETVLGVEREVRMTRTIFVLDIAVVLAALIGVVEENADGGTVGLSFKDTRPDLRHVLFLPLRDNLGLPRPPAAQIRKKVVHTERQAGRAAVDNAQIARPVADACGGDAEQFAEGISWHAIIITEPLSGLNRTCPE